MQRVAKFVKYLPDHGWFASVLTVANPSVPIYDESLVADIPSSTVIRRARTWEPSYTVKTVVSAGSERNGQRAHGARRFARQLAGAMLQPDVQVLWLPAALAEGKRLLRKDAHRAIVASGPPFSTFLVGAALSRRFRVPLVLDYRDEWNLSNAYQENRRPGPVSLRVQSWMQRRVVREARALVATTQASSEALEVIREQARSSAQVSWIYNGHDPADFPALQTPSRSSTNGDAYRIAYVGTLWNLTSVAPLVKAVEVLAAQRPDLVGRLELVFAGRRTGAQEQLLEGLKRLPCRVVEHSYLDHHEAIDLIRSADSLCVLLADVPGADRVVPAKIFESMAARRPILAIAPGGEMTELLRDYPSSHHFCPGDVEGVSGWLARQIQRPRPEHDAPRFEAWDGARYDRRHQAGQLAHILEQLV